MGREPDRIEANQPGIPFMNQHFSASKAIAEALREAISRAGRVPLMLLVMATAATPVHAEPLDLGAYAGKVVYLDFWASWCGPCRLSFPWMSNLQARLGGKDLVVIAVNVDKEPKLAQKFLAANPANFRIVYDPQGAVAEAYAIKAMPTSFLIGRDGQIRATHKGFRPEDEYEYLSHIEAALREPAPAK